MYPWFPADKNTPEPEIIRVCEDCYLYAVIGTLPPQREAEVAASMGALPAPVFAVDQEPFFSWTRCACCGDSQGGMRYGLSIGAERSYHAFP